MSWFSKDILLIAQKLEITNKSYWTLVNRDLFSPEEYISKFNWVSNWLIANQTKFYEHILAIVIVPFILILLKQFKQFNLEVDQINKTSFVKTYPELAEWYEKI